MNRRAFLASLPVGAAALHAGDAAAAAPIRSFSLPDVDALVARLDQGIADIGHALDRGVLAGLSATHPGQDAAIRGALHRAFGALLVYGSFAEQPLESQVHPALQRRMRDAATALGDALPVLGGVLEGVSPAAAGDLQGAIRRDPTFLAGVLRGIDAETAGLGLGNPLRDRLHHAFSALSWRVGHQSVAAVNAECKERLARVPADPLRASHGRDEAVARRIEAARQGWIAAGVDPADFAGPAWEETTWRTGLGIASLGLATVGMYVTAAAWYGVEGCVCVLIPVVGLALFFLIAGLLLVIRDND
jgi:hypothetical protein